MAEPIERGMQTGTKAMDNAGDEAGAQVAAIVALARTASIETVPASATDAAALAAELPAGTPVYVVALPGRALDEIAETARQLHAVGLRPVPHLPARRFHSQQQFENFVDRLTREAAVDEVLIIGGSAGRPAGPFHAAGQLIDSGVLGACGIRRIGIAGHPEGHPSVPAADMVAALGAKIAGARAAGIDVRIVSQFCFDYAAVADWLDGLAVLFPGVPVRVGVPGPASVTALVKYARMCEIGASIRFLTRGTSALMKMASWTPEGFIADLAAYRRTHSGGIVDGVHFYGFGGSVRTAHWLAAIRDGTFRLFPDGQGFTVG